jgi:transcriptional antiterminator NusG
MDWYAIHTKSRHERIVRDSLAHYGFNVFLPEHVVWSRRRDRRKQVQVPLFSGYLFVAPCDHDGWMRRVVTTRSVVRVLGLNGSPMPVPEHEVESLRVLVGSGENLEPVPYIGIGDKVRVEGGPLMGAEGVVVRKHRKEHLIISVGLMQRSVAVELIESQVVKIM